MNVTHPFSAEVKNAWYSTSTPLYTSVEYRIYHYLFPYLTFFDIIHRPSLIKHNVSETGVCLRLKVKPTVLVPVDTGSPSLQTTLVRVSFTTDSPSWHRAPLGTHDQMLMCC